MALLCAKGFAEADFLSPLSGGKGRDAVDPDGSEKQRQERESAHEIRNQQEASEALSYQVLQGLGPIQGEFGVDGPDRILNHGQSFLGASFDAGDDATTGNSALVGMDVPVGLRPVVDSALDHVGDHPDDRDPVLSVVTGDGTGQGIRSGLQVSLDEGLVDDDHEGTVLSVAVRDHAPYNRADPQCREVAR